MAFVKNKYVRGKARIKAHLRYITHRRGMEGERMSRPLFRKDLNLWEITKKTLEHIKTQFGDSVPFVATIHDDHTLLRHVHGFFIVQGKLPKEEFAKIRGLWKVATKEVRRQRRHLDGMHASRGYKKLLPLIEKEHSAILTPHRDLFIIGKNSSITYWKGLPMGQAEVISLDEVRASKQWALLRQQLHDHFDQWLDDLQAQLPEPETTLAQITETVWALRQDLTGSLTEAVVEHAHRFEAMRQQIVCETCQRVLTTRPAVPRTVETMVGSVRLERPYFYCRVCKAGVYPLDEALGLTPGRTQLDVQKAAAKLVIETSYDEAQALFHDLTGVHLGSERLHTLTNQAAEGLSVLDVAPSREQIDERIAQVAAGKWRRPVVVLGMDGAYAPTRPDRARGRRPGQRRQRARRPTWKGQWREVKGFRFYLIDGERIVHLLSWHQIQNETELSEALKEVKEANLIPEDRVRLCVVCDGASWIWEHVQSLFASARQVLDYYHCSEYLHRMAKAQYGDSQQAHEWVETTLTRLYLGKISAVLGGLKRMKATSEEAQQAISNGWAFLHKHRGRTHYLRLRRGGYPLGSGGIESANKFICHTRLKRSGAWWYEINCNQMLALRCAKYNGTFDQVFVRHQARLRAA